VKRPALVALAVLSAGCARGGHDSARLLPADRSARVTYVALGDSTVEGIGASSSEQTYVSRVYARLRSVYPAARLANLGLGGATSAHVLLRQLDRAIELGPDLVTLSITVVNHGEASAESATIDVTDGRPNGTTVAIGQTHLLGPLADQLESGVSTARLVPGLDRAVPARHHLGAEPHARAVVRGHDAVRVEHLHAATRLHVADRRLRDLAAGGASRLVAGAQQGCEVRANALEVVQAAAVGEQLVGVKLGRKHQRPVTSAPQRSA